MLLFQGGTAMCSGELSSHTSPPPPHPSVHPGTLATRPLDPRALAAFDGVLGPNRELRMKAGKYWKERAKGRECAMSCCLYIQNSLLVVCLQVTEIQPQTAIL